VCSHVCHVHSEATRSPYKCSPACIPCHSHYQAVVCFAGLAGLCLHGRQESSESFLEPIYVASSPTLESIYGVADDLLLKQFSRNSRHLLHVLQPPTRNTHYMLRICKHNFTLPIRSSALIDYNFINRMLYKDCLYISLIFQCLCYACLYACSFISVLSVILLNYLLFTTYYYYHYYNYYNKSEFPAQSLTVSAEI